jgi:hypothetical protein
VLFYIIRINIVNKIKQDINNLNEIIPSDNADMSNDKGITPRLKLMVF